MGKTIIRMHTPRLPDVKGRLRVGISPAEGDTPQRLYVEFDAGTLDSREDYDAFLQRLHLLAEDRGWRQRVGGHPALGIKRAPWWVRLLSRGSINLIPTLQGHIPGLRE